MSMPLTVNLSLKTTTYDIDLLETNLVTMQRSVTIEIVTSNNRIERESLGRRRRAGGQSRSQGF